MTEVTPVRLGPPLAEVGWNLRGMRFVRVKFVVYCVIDGVIFLAVAMLAPGVWRLLSLLFVAHFVLRLYVTRWLFAADMPRLLQVFDTGLWLETERGERFLNWDRVEGFTGVARHTPSSAAPRTTTGGLSTSPRLRAGGKTIPLERPTFGELKAVVEQIEQRLLARLGQA